MTVADSDSPTNQVYVARQPILDREEKLYAYELLFRSGQRQNANVIDATAATAQVINNSTAVGIEKLVGKHKAFVNCNRDILLSGILDMFRPQIYVLEVLEDVELDGSVVAALQQLQEKNFAIALDDFTYQSADIERAKIAMPYIAMIKVDLMLTARENWAKAAKFIIENGKIPLAEKVETEADFKECRAAGYQLFQGYFFAKPEILSDTGDLDTGAMNVIKLLQTLRSDPDVKLIEREFKQMPDLTVGMLKFINSAAVAIRNEISSVSHAVSMFGRNNLQRWLLILLYAKTTQGVDMEGKSPLFENVVQRAAMLENIVKATQPKERALQEKVYLAGIISRMDALFRMPLSRVVEKLKLDNEISAALLRRDGIIGDLLSLADAYECDDSPQVTLMLKALKIPESVFINSINESYSATGI